MKLDEVQTLGTTNNSRQWFVKKVVCGYRLWLKDVGDEEPTHAGLFLSLEKAKAEAGLK